MWTAPSSSAPERHVVQVPDRPTTYRSAVIGVSLIAVMLLFSTFFWFGIGIAAGVSQPESAVSLTGSIELVTLGDYPSLPRLLMGICSGIIGTIAAWFIADNLISDPR